MDTRIDPGAELDTLIPPPVTVTVAGEAITITPIRVRELPGFMRAIEPIFANAAAGMDIASMMMLNADAVIEATAIGARKPRAFVDALELDALIDLAEAVMEVNADFFARRLLPRLTAAGERINLALAGLSLTPDSAPQDWAR